MFLILSSKIFYGIFVQYARDAIIKMYTIFHVLIAVCTMKSLHWLFLCYDRNVFMHVLCKLNFDQKKKLNNVVFYWMEKWAGWWNVTYDEHCRRRINNKGPITKQHHAYVFYCMCVCLYLTIWRIHATNECIVSVKHKSLTKNVIRIIINGKYVFHFNKTCFIQE